MNSKELKCYRDNCDLCHYNKGKEYYAGKLNIKCIHPDNIEGLTLLDFDKCKYLNTVKIIKADMELDK